MGYFIEAVGEISFDAADEDKIIKALRDLNHQHHLKRGGLSPETGDPYTDKWFSWVDPRYHEDERLNSVRAFLEMLGFEVNESSISKPDQPSYRITYNDKQGQEVYFFQAMAPWCEIFVEVRGEDWGDYRVWKSEWDQTGLYTGGAVVNYELAEFIPTDAWY